MKKLKFRIEYILLLISILNFAATVCFKSMSQSNFILTESKLSLLKDGEEAVEDLKNDFWTLTYFGRGLELQLEKAIFAVADGNLYYNQRANQIMYLMLNKDNADQNDKDVHILSLVENYKMLSKKEQEVFKLLASGKTSKEIADILGKAEKAIINQRSNIYGKLDLHDRLDVIEAAQALGVIA